MRLLLCASCSRDIYLPQDGHFPAWCPHCGVDFKEASGEQRKKAIEALASPALLERAPVAPLRRSLRQSAAAAPADAFTPAEPRVPVEPAVLAPEPEAIPEPVEIAELAEDPVPTLVPLKETSGWDQLNLGALGLAALFLLACLVLTNTSVDKLTTHKKVPGKVVRLVPGRKGRTYPEVSYWMAGNVHQIRGSSSSGSYRVGDTVEVLVPTNQPGEGTINRFSEMWIGAVLTGVLGAGCLWVGLSGRGAKRSAAATV